MAGFDGPNYGNAQVDLVVKEAVDAERERCAKIAEGFKPGFCGDDKDVLRHDLAQAIANAIRGDR